MLLGITMLFTVLQIQMEILRAKLVLSVLLIVNHLLLQLQAQVQFRLRWDLPIMSLAPRLLTIMTQAFQLPILLSQVEQ